METIEINGQEFALGCHERTVEAGAVRPCLEEQLQLIAPDKWEPCDFSDLVPPATLQKSHGACVGCNASNAVAAAAELAGEKWILSGWDLYRMVCGGRDGGASIHAALQVLHDRGVCSQGLVPEFTLSARDSEAEKTDAARHKVLESFDCPDRLSIATAVQLRFAQPLGIAVYTNFAAIEEIGGKPCIPRPAGRLRGLHCVHACGLDYIGSAWRVKIATKSWGLDFGDQGCAWYNLAWLDQRILDAWCVRSVSISNS